MASEIPTLYIEDPKVLHTTLIKNVWLFFFGFPANIAPSIDALKKLLKGAKLTDYKDLIFPGFNYEGYGNEFNGVPKRFHTKKRG